MTRFEIATDDASHSVCVIDGVDVSDHVTAIGIAIDSGARPVITVRTSLPGTITGDGLVQVVNPPTREQIDDAAIAALERIDVDELGRRCAAAVRQSGRRDPYKVCLETIVEMARG